MSGRMLASSMPTFTARAMYSGKSTADWEVEKNLSTRSDIGVIVNGDGNGNPAQVSTVETAGTLAYKDLLSFWNSFEPYQLNTLLAGADTMPMLLALSRA